MANTDLTGSRKIDEEMEEDLRAHIGHIAVTKIDHLPQHFTKMSEEAMRNVNKGKEQVQFIKISVWFIE